MQLLSLAHQHLGANLTAFEVMGRFALSLVARHFPLQRVPFMSDAVEAPAWGVLL